MGTSRQGRTFSCGVFWAERHEVCLAHLCRNEPLLARESMLECPSLWGHGRHLGKAVFVTPGLGASGKGDVGGREGGRDGW